jgi:hypothetical protein
VKRKVKKYSIQPDYSDNLKDLLEVWKRIGKSINNYESIKDIQPIIIEKGGLKSLF